MASPTFDAAYGNKVTGATSNTWSHTTVSGQSNKILLVAVDAGASISSVTYAGNALTLLDSISYNSGEVLSIYYLLAPVSGTYNVIVTGSSSTYIVGASASYYGVAHNSPFGTAAHTSGSGASSTNTVATSSTNQLVIDIVNNATASSDTASSGQTTREQPTGSGMALGDIAATGSSMTLGWSFTSSTWAQISVAMNTASLTTYGSSIATTTLPSAGALATTTGGTDSAITTKIGLATGYGEMYALGYTGAWPAFGSIGSPSGNGWLHDSMLLSLQTILAGNWTPTLKMRAGAGTLTADLYVRVWAFDTANSTYTAIGTMLLAAQTINTTLTTYTFSATALPAFSFNATQRLYFDVWLNVTGNAGGGSGNTINNRLSTSSTQGVASDMQVVTPGYVPNPALATNPASLTFAASIGGANPAAQNDTISETAGTATAWTSAIAYGSGSGWLSILPSSGSLAANGTATIVVTCTTGTLAIGTYTAAVTLTATTGGAIATISVTFVVVGPSQSIMDLHYQKVQQVKVYDVNGNYLGIWADAPLIVGLKDTINACQSPVKLVLPRKIDNFDGVGQYQSVPASTWGHFAYGTGIWSEEGQALVRTANTVVQGNTVQIYLYGPGLPATGLLKFQGYIDSIEPTITDKNDEGVTVTLTPLNAAIADHGYGGTLTFTSVDPIAIFNHWFNTVDPLTGAGVYYSDPLTLAVGNPTTSGLSVNYNVTNLNLKSIFDTVMLMLGDNWYWRPNSDNTVTLKQLSATPDHYLLLGQHMQSLSYQEDNSQRYNVIYFVGSTGVSAHAVGASAKPIRQGGIGEKIKFLQDSRITDNATAQIIANAQLALYDQPFIRAKCRLVDYRGDSKTALGIDIENFHVGETVSIIDARAKSPQTQWGSFRWGQAQYGSSSGSIFNTTIPIQAITYGWRFIDVEIGSLQPSQDRRLFSLEKKLNDYSLAQ